MTIEQPADGSTLTRAEVADIIDKLTGRVIASEGALTDAEDLRKENTALRTLLAMTAFTEPEAAAQLREWLPDHDTDASMVAMPTAMARKLLAELDRVTQLLGGLRTEWAFQYTVYGVTGTSLPCDTREDAEREAGRHHRGAPIVSRLVQDWQPDQYETDIEEGPDPKAGDHGTCSPCGEQIVYIDSPFGGWWAHEVHPADEHDAELGGPA